jgi:F-type H+-transporting ATPase subunit gamma
MSTLAQHKSRLSTLHDIRDIMAALKNISLTESQRLRHFLDTQRRVVDGIELAMTDFLGHYPQTMAGDAGLEIILLVGSERGFCGDFNETLAAQLVGTSSEKIFIAVGEKLAGKLDEANLFAETMVGPTTVEDVPGVLLTVVDKLHEISARHGEAQLSIVYHQYDGDGIILRLRRPFRDFSAKAPRHGYPPLLNVPPYEFFLKLLDHYLFAVLHDIFYSSLAAEHQLRLRHLQGSIDHLDRQCAALTQRYNSLRQELITEEIELIILSAGSLVQEQ